MFIKALKPQQKINYSAEFGPEFKGVSLSWLDVCAYVPVPKPGWIFQRQDKHQPFKRVLNNGNVYNFINNLQVQENLP